LNSKQLHGLYDTPPRDFPSYHSPRGLQTALSGSNPFRLGALSPVLRPAPWTARRNTV